MVGPLGPRSLEFQEVAPTVIATLKLVMATDDRMEGGNSSVRKQVALAMAVCLTFWIILSTVFFFRGEISRAP